MSPEQWQLAKAVLPRIVGHPLADQERLVREVFADQPGVWSEVLRVARATTRAWTTAVNDIPAPSLAASDRVERAPRADSSAADVPEGPIFSAGETCGPYRIISLIGEGGMGQVFLAHDTRTERADLPPRKVALKCLRGKWLASPDARRTLMQEAHGVAAVGNHPNLATLYDILEVRHGQALVLVMEYVDGVSLSELTALGPLPWRLAVLLVKQVAEGIAHAHESGVIHCDIKPENVRVTPRNQAKLIDFGLSRAKDLPTDPKERLGTLPYMAPERLLDGELTMAGDVYSLAVTLYEVLTGRRPFDGEDELTLISNILLQEPALASTHAPDVPRVVSHAVAKALDKYPTQRPSARELISDFDRILHVQRATAGEWAVRAAIVVGAGVVLLTALGFVSSTVFDSGMGRTGAFRQESPLMWPLWGLRSLVLPGVAICGALLVLSIVQPLTRGFALLQRNDHTLAVSRLTSHASNNIAALTLWVLVLQVGTLAGFLAYFAPVMTGMVNFAVPSAPGELRSLLKGDTSELPDYFRFSMTFIVFVSGLAWARVVGRSSFWSNSEARLPAAAGLAVLILSLGLLAAPYRVVHHNASERVCLGQQVCYLAAQQADESLLFCPESGERRRVVATRDPAMVRTGIVENIFSVFSSMPSERCTAGGQR